jgi:hypothetical protein
MLKCTAYDPMYGLLQPNYLGWELLRHPKEESIHERVKHNRC